MALPIPNVPIAPGVPPLPRGVGAISAGVELLITDAIRSLGFVLAPRWGLFKNGLPVITAESVVSLDYKQDWAIADYPLEKGAFESYDKVQTPFAAKFRFSSGGSEAARQALLTTIAAAANSLDLYDVVTPEVNYTSVNVSHYDYRRTAAAGLGLMVVDVWVVQVRVTATSQFTQTKQPNGSSTDETGFVQAFPATPNQTNKIPLVQ